MNILALVLVVLPLAASQLIGGPMTVDVNRDDIQQMASFALTQLNTLLGSQNTLVSVVQAKTQVVAGIKYFLTLDIKNGKETQTCTVTVWSRVWLNDKQVTQHACTSRTKRDGLVGATTSVNVTRTDVLKMATYAVTTLNRLQGVRNGLDQVISAKTQVVSGTNYFLKIRMSDGSQTQICDVTIWDQPWSYMTQMTHHSCVNAKRRDIGMPGGLFNADINSPDVKNMTNFALGELNRLMGAQNSIVDVISAKTQVVAGMNYFLKIRLSDGSQTQICDVTIWDQPWTHMTQMTHHSCVNAKRRDIGMPGGLINADVNSPDVKDMANFALGEINGVQNAQNSMVQIISAKTQVVAGMNYILTMRLKEGDKTQICYVKIWSQPWLHRKEMTEHSCSQVTKRAGGLLGGPTGVDVNSAEIQEVANFALTEINGIQGAQNALVKVVNARKQIVSGINYILTLRLQNGDKTQLCEVTVWYQSWTNMKQVTGHHCSAESKRSTPVLGGVEPAHLSAPMQQAVSFAEDALNGKMNSMFRMVTEKVDHVTQQVVAGIKYSFDLHLVTSSCMNNPDGNGKGITDCPASSSMPQHMTCRVSVLYQAWSDPNFQLLSDTCGQLA
ncbi:uncharacterized protein [Haliotis asinina]|uniref:uncharacterized protein n=1 Tax=Haliotis asinina TaxID=109174 RepID=UPI0035318091